MVKFYFPAVLLLAALCSGCASSSHRQSSGETGAEQALVYRFIGEGRFSEICKDDRQIQFVPGSLILSNTHLLLTPSGRQRGGAGELRIPLSDLKGAALYQGDVTHSNQLQLKYKKSVLVILVTGTQQTDYDARTVRLYELLIAEGVPRLKSEQFYFVGMDLSKRRHSSFPLSGFLSAAGGQLGKLIWSALKTASGLMISPFKP